MTFHLTFSAHAQLPIDVRLINYSALHTHTYIHHNDPDSVENTNEMETRTRVLVAWFIRTKMLRFHTPAALLKYIFFLF